MNAYETVSLTVALTEVIQPTRSTLSLFDGQMPDTGYRLNCLPRWFLDRDT